VSDTELYDMAYFSKNELEAIKPNPSGAGLDAFRDLVNSKYLYPGGNHEDVKELILSGASDTRELLYLCISRSC
jgi:hypothetical protein